MEADVTGPLTTSAQDWEKGGGDFGGSFLVREQAGTFDDFEACVWERGDHRLGP